MKVAGLQLDIVWEEPEANFQKIRPWISQAAGQGVHLLVLPEMFSYGFSMATDRISEPSDGPSTRFLVEEASAHAMWLAGSLPEKAPGAERPANTFLLAGPGGKLHRYRKIHPFSYAREHLHYDAGESLIQVEVEEVRLTPFICYDLRFGDGFWQVAAETDLYLVVANWPEERRRHWITLLEARAIENQAYVVGVNRVGEGGSLRYAGDSRIFGPSGEILAAADDQEALLIADIQPEAVQQVRRKLPFLRDRRPTTPVKSGE